MRNEIFCSALTATMAAAAVGAPKFIGTGWDIGPNQPPSAILGMADAFARTGLDGVVVVMPEMYGDSAMSPKSFTREMAGKYVADLRKFKGKPGLSESFILAAWSPIPKAAPRLAWTDDAAWAHFAANMRTYAWLARESGLRGLFVDNEDYLKKRQFWRAAGEPPYARLRDVARRRGAEVGRALFETYPGISCILYWILTIDPGYTTALDPVAYRDMKEDLWPSFVDGILDVMPATATLVDGDEHGYVYVAEKHEFAEALAARSRRLLALLSPENRAKYRAQVQMGFGQYMDMYTNPEGATYYHAPKGGSRLARFRENLAGALAASDSYVWFYGEKFKWVDWPGFKPPAGWMKIGRETWEQKLPGFAQMLRDAKDPVAALRADLDARRGTGENRLAKALANPQSFWKADGASVGFDFRPGKGRGGSVLIATTGTGDGCVLLDAGPVTPGEAYVGEIFVRGKSSRICLCWKRGGAWRWSVAAAEAVIGDADGDGWRRAILRAAVPPEIDGMVLKADVNPKAGETVEFSGAAAYRAVAAERPGKED